MSLYIWDIQISGQYSHTEESIIKFLKQDQVYAGIQKSKLSCQKIEEDIRKKFTDIGWVSAEIRGTRLLIKITETNMPKPYEEQTEPCHIIAPKDGIIDSIITRKGTPLVRKGDVVKKGAILVGGYINLYGDDATVVSQKADIADADIIIKSYYNYQDEFSLEYIDKEYTGNSRRFYTVTILGKRFYLLNPLKDYDSYDYYDEAKSENTWKLNTNFYLPFSTGSTEYMEYNEVKRVYSKEEAIKKAQKQLERYIDALKENGVEILKNNVTIEVMKKKCVAKGKLIVKEPVHTTKKVKESELIKEPPATPDPEKSGD
ncbi:stage IV sporulation protein [Lachnospiraceae bacterium KM106-2]|nr:stage IV sporulation protein [Lachnospiraceae bacterium KM106-2]